MPYKVLVVSIVVLVLGLFSVDAMGEDSTSQDEVPYFTNKDIEKYKKSDHETVIEQTGKKAEKNKKTQGKKEQKEKDYWCKKSMEHKKKVDKKKNAIAVIEKELFGEDNKELSHKKKRTLEKKLERAKRDLGYAERDLAELEDTAHRKGIPPGWLRCQFE
ncbi:MAG: hypothetical protein AB1610_08285 [Nitrospirota bacterium]